MKKLMIAFAIVAMATASQAALLDWKYTGATSTQVGDTIYLIIGTTAAASWDSAAAVAAAAIQTGGSGAIASTGHGNYGVSKKTASPVGGTDGTSGYFVIVSSDGKKWGTSGVYDFTSGSGSALLDDSWIYDPNKQQSSPGQFNVTGLSATKDFGAVPEPTSGLLLLLGVAGLALKRRRA